MELKAGKVAWQAVQRSNEDAGIQQRAWPPVSSPARVDSAAGLVSPTSAPRELDFARAFGGRRPGIQTPGTPGREFEPNR